MEQDAENIPITGMSSEVKTVVWKELIFQFLKVHPHCNNCVSLHCTEPPPSCAMVHCELGCGSKFHACKLEEHEQLCCVTRVPCINVASGCTVQLARYQQAQHLVKCPASVVVCSTEWGRTPKDDRDVSPVVAQHLDTLVTFRDQKHLEDAWFPSGLVRLSPLCPSPEKWGDLPVNPAQAKVLRFLQAHTKRMALVKSGEAENPDPSKPWPLLLNSTIEFGSRYHSCASDKYVYVCGAELRRDMYSWHFKNVHNDILCGLNGWLDHRCPLESLDCNFSQRRMYPDTPDAKVVYDSVMECFAVRYEDSESSKQETECCLDGCGTNCDSREVDNSDSILCRIPLELLEQICDFLDPLSLANLALTSHQLRDVCGSQLARQGIVTLSWHKTGSSPPHWRVQAKSWKFPKFFTPIRKWGHHETTPMVHHMATCDKYQRHLTDVPFNMRNGEPPPASLLAACMRAQGGNSDTPEIAAATEGAPASSGLKPQAWP